MSQGECTGLGVAGFATSSEEVLLSYTACCGFAEFPFEEPFLPSPAVALPLVAANLLLHVPAHAFGFQASDFFSLSFVFTISSVF